MSIQIEKLFKNTSNRPFYCKISIIGWDYMDNEDNSTSLNNININ